MVILKIQCVLESSMEQYVPHSTYLNRICKWSPGDTYTHVSQEVGPDFVKYSLLRGSPLYKRDSEFSYLHWVSVCQATGRLLSHFLGSLYHSLFPIHFTTRGNVAL